jgi:hypothetical protein
MTNEERKILAHRILEVWMDHDETYCHNNLTQAEAVLDFVEKIIREDCAIIAREISEEHSLAIFDSFRSGQSSGALSVAYAIEKSIPKDETK